MEIGAAAQRRFVRKLLHHRVGSGIDHLIHDRGCGAIDERLVRYQVARGRSIVAQGCARVRDRDALARRQFSCDGIAGGFARRRLNNGYLSRRPYRPDAEIRTHGSLLASLESNPNPLLTQLWPAALNDLLENALNFALKCTRQLNEKCSYPGSGVAREAQSERLTASGVMCRGPGAAR